jgi:chromosome segregation ATPase
MAVNLMTKKLQR